jgi:hypothetical protein
VIATTGRLYRVTATFIAIYRNAKNPPSATQRREMP